MLDHSLYQEDCEKVGVLDGPDPADLQDELKQADEKQKKTDEKQKNTVLFVFIIVVFSILLPFNIYLKLLVGTGTVLAVLAYIRQPLRIERR